MNLKSIALGLVVFVFAVAASAAEFNVKMYKDSRYQDGSFQSFMGDTVVDLIPVNVESAAALNAIANKAFELNKAVTVSVEGSVVRSDTVNLPRNNGSFKVIGVSVRMVK